MKKTVTRLESRMSSIWDLPVRAFAGVKRLVLIVRMRWASSRMATSSLSVDGRGVAEVLEQRAGAAADDLAQVLGERLGAGQVERAEAALGELRDEVEGDDRLAGAGAAFDEEDDVLLVLAGAADGVEDRVVGDELLVEEHERRLVADDAGDVVEQALVRLEGGRGDAIEDRAAFVRAGDALSRNVANASDWSPANAGFVPRSVAKSAW